jgi:RNA polymerase subunit RPABC4/transcription elongation factor Spt4
MKTVERYFEKRTALIATMHAKELVMQPILERALAVQCVVTSGFDTDAFGTFSGEVERTLPALETLRTKINNALDETGYDLGFGSEGSFGPHPQIPLVAANVELVMLLDRKHNLEIVSSHLTTETNFKQETVGTIAQLADFATLVGFPSHGIILRGESSSIKKGIITWDELHLAACAMALGKNTLTIETDMRALFNPTRMKTIQHCTHLLVEKILAACPLCGTPGFAEAEWVTGLPCEACGEPTALTKEKIKICNHCGNKDIEPVDAALASAQYCNSCNP